MSTLSIRTMWCRRIPLSSPPRRPTGRRLFPASPRIPSLPANFTPRKARRSGSGSWPTLRAWWKGSDRMLIIPAIDIKGGRCVRLFQGEMEKETIYFDSPLEAAKHWVDQGAEFLHVVDLDGAVAGRPVHTQEVAAICMGFGVPLEMGGGLRSLEAIEAALALGVARVVVGTAAYADRDLLRAACKRFPGKIAVGIDAREGRVAIKGWKEDRKSVV